MAEKMKMGVLGCGDFLRWQAGDIEKSSLIEVTKLYDPDTARAGKFAEQLKGQIASSGDEVIEDAETDIVCLFVPPWARKDLILKAAQAGKQIITTKPLGPSVAECAEMVEAVDGKVAAGVVYRRTGNTVTETYRDLFDSGEIGRLALYRQDWIHHYPQWNTWALDPSKNGGPFMDAMIHNQNIARYLMARPATHCTFFSDSHAHTLQCADTEYMKLDFADRGTAHLLMTWAADLAVHSTEGNYREHIDHQYMITDKGWYVTEVRGENGLTINATRLGENKSWPIKKLPATVYDRFVEAVQSNGPLPRDLPSVLEAYEDIKLLRDAEQSIGSRMPVDLSLASADVTA